VAAHTLAVFAGHAKAADVFEVDGRVGRCRWRLVGEFTIFILATQVESADRFLGVRRLALASSHIHVALRARIRLACVGALLLLLLLLLLLFPVSVMLVVSATPTELASPTTAVKLMFAPTKAAAVSHAILLLLLLHQQLLLHLLEHLVLLLHHGENVRLCVAAGVHWVHGAHSIHPCGPLGQAAHVGESGSDVVGPDVIRPRLPSYAHSWPGGRSPPNSLVARLVSDTMEDRILLAIHCTVDLAHEALLSPAADVSISVAHGLWSSGAAFCQHEVCAYDKL